jgi:hypothetical protein
VLIQASLVKGPHESVATYFTVKSSIRSADDPGSSTSLSAALRRECCGGKTYVQSAYALLLASIVLILITPG